MREATAARRRQLYSEASKLVARDYRQALTLETLATALAGSPRQIQRAYAEIGGCTFREDLRARRLQAAAELLAAQPSIAVAQVGRIVGYAGSRHFSRLFRAGYGLTPGEFRGQAMKGAPAGEGGKTSTALAPGAGRSGPATGGGPAAGEGRRVR